MLHNARIKMVMDTVERLLVNTHTHVCTHTHKHTRAVLSATLSVILCCCHSNHLTFPSQSRPNETTGGHGEGESSKGVAERCRHREKQTCITGRWAAWRQGCHCLVSARCTRETLSVSYHSRNKSHCPASSICWLHCLLMTTPQVQFAALAFPCKSNNIIVNR